MGTGSVKGSKDLLRDDIRIMGANLSQGTSLRDCCPSCHGGNKREKSFVLTRMRDGLAYACHRASCKLQGFITENAVYNNIKNNIYNNNINNNNIYNINNIKYTKPLLPLKERQINALVERYGIQSKTVTESGWLFALEDMALWSPYYSLRGDVFGEQIRKFGRYSDREPKVRTFYRNKDTVKLHWPRQRTYVKCKKLLVCEDIISAAKLAELWDVVALLGTSVNPAKARAMRDVSASVMFVLDPDTWQGSTSIAHDVKKKFGGMFDKFEIVKLSKDPKDCDWGELIEKIGD